MWSPENDREGEGDPALAAVLDFWRSRLSFSVLALILLSVALETAHVFAGARGPRWEAWLGLDSSRVWAEPWRLVTYWLFHHHPLELLGTMVAIWFFGAEVERAWGRLGFLAFALFCAAMGGLAWVTAGPLLGRGGIPLFGATAVASGVVFAACLGGRTRVIPFGILLSISTRVLAWVLLGISVLFLVRPGPSTLGLWRPELHLGGALAAVVAVRGAPMLGAWLGRWRSRIEVRLIEQETQLQAELDRVLARLHAVGRERLTPEERDVLTRASRKLRQTMPR